jgi:hypothetical protein
VAMNTRPLRPDEDELLVHTKDFMVFPVLVPTESQVSDEEAPETAVPGQGAAGGTSGSRTGSPADQSKKRPAEDNSGGKGKRSKKGRFGAALKSKLLSPSAQPNVDRRDNPDVTILEPPQGIFFFLQHLQSTLHS